MASAAEIAQESRSRFASAMSRLAGLTYAQRQKEKRLVEQERQTALRQSMQADMAGVQGTYGGAAAGMSLGGSIGTAVGTPGWGTALGAGIGALAGGLLGGWGEGKQKRDIAKEYRKQGLKGAHASSALRRPDTRETIGLLASGAGVVAGGVGAANAAKNAAAADEMREAQIAYLRSQSLRAASAGGMPAGAFATGPSSSVSFGGVGGSDIAKLPASVVLGGSGYDAAAARQAAQFVGPPVELAGGMPALSAAPSVMPVSSIENISATPGALGAAEQPFQLTDEQILQILRQNPSLMANYGIY